MPEKEGENIVSEQQKKAQQEPDLNQLRKVRREKLADLQANGKDPFVITKYDQTHHSLEIKENFEELAGKEVSIAGRMMSKRVMGKASFCNVQDLQGNIQSYVARDSIGEEAYKEALNITEQLFAGNIKNLSVKELKQGLRGVPNYQVQAEDNLNIVELLVTSGVVNSKRQAREDVQNGAIYVNGDRIQDLDYVLNDSDKLENELTVIRRGKKKYFVLTY